MLAANLPVCQYAVMPGQNNSGIANSSNTSANCTSNIPNQIFNSNNNITKSVGNSNVNNHTSVGDVSSTNTTNNLKTITNISNNIKSNSSNCLLSNNNNFCSGGISNSNIIIGNNGGLALDYHIGGLVDGGTSTAATKNQLEQLNTMREALFSQDGWGCQHVNQDTNWEVPSSPEPTNKDPSGPPMWKPTINNGTDLWESNLRNGGQPTAQAVQKTPWGHTPSTNLGGTWGEDDDCADVSNVWTGGPSGPTSIVGVSGVTPASASGPTNGSQWSQNVGVSGSGVQAAVAAQTSIAGVAAGGNATTGTVNLSGTPGGGASGAGSGWGDPRVVSMSGGACPLDIRSVDPRDPMRAPSAGEPRELRMLDPRDPIRGDPRGISGRLNGTSEMWGQHHPIPQHQMSSINKMGVGGPNSGGVGTGIGAAGPSSITASSVGGLNTTGNVASQWGLPPPSIVGAQKDLVGSIGQKPSVSNSGWEEPSPPAQRRNIPNYDDGTSLWGQQTRVPGGVCGSGEPRWKDISDPLNTRSHIARSAMGVQNSSNVSNLSVCGVNSSGNPIIAGAGGVGSTVNPNNPMGVGVGSLGPTATRLVPAANGPGMGSGPHKPDTGMWPPHPAGPPNVASTAGVGGNRNTGWGEVENHNVIGGAISGSATAAGNWSDEKANQVVGNISQPVSSWNEPPSGWNKPNQPKLTGATGSAGWGIGVSNTASSLNDSNDLNHNDWVTTTHNSLLNKAQQQQKLGGSGAVNIAGLNSDLIKQSKQYRMLVETGFKKEDVERLLIATNMNYEETNEMLRANFTAVTASMGGMDNWRRHDDNLSSYVDHNVAVAAAASNSFPTRYATGGTQPALSFPPNNILNSMAGIGSVGASGGNNPQLSAVNSTQPLQVQKFINQGPHIVGAGVPQSVSSGSVPFSQGSNSSAVNAAVANASGISNSTNQPSTQQLRMLVQQIQLAVHSGYLSSQILNQPLAPTTLLLLNQLLSNIKHLQGAQQSLARSGNNGNTLLAIAKYKQQIQNLQNQINAQQSMYIKQQVLQPTPHAAATHINNTNNEYLRSHDAISGLQGSFSEINLNKSAGYQGVPNQQSRLNQWKLPVLDKDNNTDSTDFSRAPGATKLVGTLPTANTNNMGPLGLQGDGAWSTGRNINDGWPDQSNDSENKDWSVGQPSTATAYTDLVQEFEPGKPWKGSQIKSIEDDPSITPGSVARSPLSINPTPKDADIFSNTASKNSPTDLASLGLTSSSTWSFNPTTSNQNFPSWSDNTQQEIWTSMNKTSRGPPPGLGSNKSNGGGSGIPNATNSCNANGWPCGSRTGGWSGQNSNWNSNWLLLKNLTAQIDSSTLRTLCMQHGPLLNFHLYLNQGIALCKYATREEANKAQMTLNNCFLGNTTIIAESPNESEVHSILHHLPQQNINSTASQQQQIQHQNQTLSHNIPAVGNNTERGVCVAGGTSNTNTNNVNASGSQNSLTPGGTLNGINQQSNNPAHNTNNAITNANSVQNGNQSSNPNSHPNTNTSNTSNVTVNNSNSTSSNLGNTNSSTGWRTNNQQSQQPQVSQTRPSGGRDDFEFISKYVCSIVDD